MDAAIKKLNDNGTDTSKLTADEASFNQLVTEVRANQVNTTELFNVQGDASQRATIKSLKEVSKQVLKFVRDFRQISRGEIKIEGKVTSTLSGKGE
jgi:hypothetical protein